MKIPRRIFWTAIFAVIALSAVLAGPKLFVPKPKTPLDMFHHSISKTMMLNENHSIKNPLALIWVSDEEQKRRFEESMPLWLDMEPFEWKVITKPIHPYPSNLTAVFNIGRWTDEQIILSENYGGGYIVHFYTQDGCAWGNMLSSCWGPPDFYSQPPFPATAPPSSSARYSKPITAYSRFIPIRALKAWFD